MSYAEEDINRMLEAGEAQRNEDGAIVWSPANTLGKRPGTWVVRPPGAAEVITQDTGGGLARKRQEKRLEAIDDGFAAGISKAKGLPLTTDEALSAVVALFAERVVLNPNRKDYVRALELTLDMLRARQKNQTVVDKRTQIIEIDDAEFTLMRGWGPLPDRREKGIGRDSGD